jgi:hypothetical protein
MQLNLWTKKRIEQEKSAADLTQQSIVWVLFVYIAL